jgi:citrate synthase
LQAQAQRGELTPQAQQSLQAVQAQAAQQAQRRGGVGVAQSQQQIENFRQQLLAQQYDLGLKISGIGDQIALGAIRTGMQADQYVNQLTGSYYGNIARVLFGAGPEAAQQQRGA